MKSHLPAGWCLVLASAALSACAFYATSVTSVDRERLQESKIALPTKVHLTDGSAVLCEQGFEIKGETLTCAGIKYDLTRTVRSVVDAVPTDSIASLEYYKEELQTGASVAGSAAAGVAATPLVIIGVKAIFGSCPTVYSFDGTRYFLEAETFTHSVAKRFEADDLDRLDFGRVVNGEYLVQVANEALETHYINQMTLLTVDHAAGYEAFHTEDHEIILFGREAEILEAKSKLGRDVLPLVSTRDGRSYQSDSPTVQALTRELTEDWVDVRVSVPPGARTMYLALRLRNSLLSTVLFYDVILASQGVHAIEWLGSRTANLFYAWRLHNWFERHFGLRVQLLRGTRVEDVARIPLSGPIAWHQVAVALPAPSGPTVALRLAFLPDNWVVDWVGVSFDHSTDYRVNQVHARTVVDADGNQRDDLLWPLRESDSRYLITHPGDRHLLTFNPGPVPEGRQRTYFLKSRGFYIEWLRQEWLARRPDGEEAVPFELNDDTVVKTARLWLRKKDRFEKEFFESKVPGAGGATP